MLFGHNCSVINAHNCSIRVNKASRAVKSAQINFSSCYRLIQVSQTNYSPGQSEDGRNLCSLYRHRILLLWVQLSLSLQGPSSVWVLNATDQGGEQPREITPQATRPPLCSPCHQAKACCGAQFASRGKLSTTGRESSQGSFARDSRNPAPCNSTLPGEQGPAFQPSQGNGCRQFINLNPPRGVEPSIRTLPGE